MSLWILQELHAHFITQLIYYLCKQIDSYSHIKGNHKFQKIGMRAISYSWEKKDWICGTRCSVPRCCLVQPLIWLNSICLCSYLLQLKRLKSGQILVRLFNFIRLPSL